MKKSITHKTFSLTQNHISLLSKLITDNEKLSLLGETDTNASPFSEHNTLIEDLEMILVGKRLTDDEKQLEKNKDVKELTESELLKIYSELPTALEIILQTKSFNEGVYYTPKHFTEWVLKPEKWGK